MEFWEVAKVKEVKMVGLWSNRISNFIRRDTENSFSAHMNTKGSYEHSEKEYHRRNLSLKDNRRDLRIKPLLLEPSLGHPASRTLNRSSVV